MFVVYEVLHFRNNNSQLQPADVTVTLLISVREYPSSIYGLKTFIDTLNYSGQMMEKLLQYD